MWRIYVLDYLIIDELNFSRKFTLLKVKLELPFQTLASCLKSMNHNFRAMIRVSQVKKLKIF
jgi:hypothetical protein